MWKSVTCVILLYLFIIIQSEDAMPEKDKGECGQNSTNPTGGFHLAVANLSKGECKWYIKPNITKGEAQISLFIHSLFLHQDDQITLYKSEEDSKNDTLSLVPPIRAQNGSITIITEEPFLIIKLEGTDKDYQRQFDGMFQGQVCAFPIPPELQIIHSPIHTNVNVTTVNCQYTYNKDPHYRAIPVFVFKKFNFSSSQVEFSHSTHDGPYHHDPPVDIFPTPGAVSMGINVKLQVPSNEYFQLHMHKVDSSCSYFKLLDSQSTEFQFDSPDEVLNNGTIVTECRWIFQHPDKSEILGLNFGKLLFDDTLDIIAVNDGGSELSPPLLQMTASTNNSTSRLIRSTGAYLWIAFKPRTYASKMSANITIHGQGGYFKGHGTISVKPTVGNDTVFLLEVEQDQVVLLNFTSSNFPYPANLSIYDGFDKTTLLATLHGNVWYPVLSRSSKMMIIATSFSAGQFAAEFKGVSSGCLHMSSFSNENYILSGNCNSTCLWVIPPQDRPGLELMLNLPFISLAKDDEIEILKLDAAKTKLGEVLSNVNHIPQLLIPSNVGALVEINRRPCVKPNDDIVLVGHSSYVPVCGKDLTLEPQMEFQITSPLHPDTYPLLGNCKWNLATGKGNLVHLAFQSFKLAPNHCVKITHSADNKTDQFDGNTLPEDLFILGGSVIQFDSTDCKTSKAVASLKSDEGFMLNGTVADCGAVLTSKSGEFAVQANKTLCIWKVTIPETENNANDIVNIVSYAVNKKDDVGNYKFQVYDGSSVREPIILNDTNAEIWSRTNSLIFIYKRIDVKKPSSILSIKYSTIHCNESMLCDNKMCLHPDWRCNGINECGDFSDERNCASVPIPPEIKEVGYTPTAFWITLLVILAVGVALGFGVPLAYHKYKNGQYRQFADISVIE